MNIITIFLFYEAKLAFHKGGGVKFNVKIIIFGYFIM